MGQDAAAPHRVLDYVFEHRSWLPVPPEDVHERLVDLEHYVDWWPQVRAVASLGPDDALVLCRSVLPYDLELRLHARSREPGRLEVGLDGPIRGWARWRLSRAERSGRPGTLMEYHQQVRAVAPSFVLGSYLLRPLLRWNHARMMAGAEQGLRSTLLGDDGDQDRAARTAS